MSTKSFCLTAIVFFSGVYFFVACNSTAPKKSEPSPVPDVTVPSPGIEEEDTTDYYEPDDLELGYTLTHAKTDTMSQTDLNFNSYENCMRAKKRLNIIIDSIKILYHDDPDLIALLNKSQIVWGKYYHSMYQLWHHPDSSWGTIGPLCVNDFCRAQYDKRIRELNPWLHGAMQMDGCSGSKRILDYTYNDVLETEKRNKITDGQDNISLAVFDNKTILKKLFDTKLVKNNNEVLWKPNYYERMNFQVSKDGYCHTIVDTLINYNSTHKLIVFSTTSEEYGCHVCAPTISVATFSKDEKGVWSLNFFQKMFRQFGSFGETGSYGVEKLGSDFYCLKLHANADGNHGEFWGFEHFYYIEENFVNCNGCTEPIKEVFSYCYYHTDEGARADDDTSTVDNSDEEASLKIIPTKGKYSHYNIQVSTKKGNKLISTENYKYEDEKGVYVLVK